MCVAPVVVSAVAGFVLALAICVFGHDFGLLYTAPGDRSEQAPLIAVMAVALLGGSRPSRAFSGVVRPHARPVPDAGL